VTTYKLYVKTHTKSGLKYLGKTTVNNPEAYTGSGVYWQRHLKVHGLAHTTEIIGEYKTFEELREAGLYFSNLWKVVESKEWANLCEENGHGSSGWKHIPMDQRKINSRKGGKKGGLISGKMTFAKGTGLFSLSKKDNIKNASTGGTKALSLKLGIHSPGQLAKTKERSINNNPFKGKKHTKSARKKMQAWHKHQIWVTDGKINVETHLTQLPKYEKLGYRRGRTITWKAGRKKKNAVCS
jgi:hypothetical protein